MFSSIYFWNIKFIMFRVSGICTVFIKKGLFMLRITLSVMLLCVVGAGCFPTRAPEVIPVYHSVSEANSAVEPYFLDLSGGGGDDISALATAAPGMVKLSLRGSKLSAEDSGIGSVATLIWLDLGSTGITNMPEDVCRLKSLSTLYMSDNMLQSLPNEIGELEGLIYLNLDRNKLKELPRSIGNLKNLKWLRLNGNRLSSLPGEIAFLENLERLYLRKNKLTALPVDLSSLKNLEWLLLEGNAFPDSEQKRIREALPDCNIEF